MTTAEAAVPRKVKGDQELKQALQRYCRLDNSTNWIYLLRAYAVIAASIGATIGLFSYLSSEGYSLWWGMPLAVAAITAIGASQHQLAGGTHEATHHMLFKNRWLNELASDWLCMFPLLSSTYSFRLYHLAHHQFVNDVEHDPDFAVLNKSGHWLRFPVRAREFLGLLARQSLIVPLLRYTLVRFRYNGLGVEMASAYRPKQRSTRLPERIGVAWLAGLAAMQVALCRYGDWRLAAILPLAYALLVAGVFFALPERHFPCARLKPVVPRRWLASGRVLFMSILFASLTIGQIVSGQPIWLIFLGLWAVPMFTTFPFFMIMRQVVQHGNGDRGWLTNTRVFLVNPLVRYAVFPFGMDYHLPHHMFATVPHYNLPGLHEYLLQFPEYASEACVAKNYVVAERGDHRRPTVLEALGPAYGRRGDEIFIDDSVLDRCEVDEHDEIRHASRRPVLKPATGEVL